MGKTTMTNKEIMEEASNYTKQGLLDKLSKTKNLSGKEIKILLSFFEKDSE